MVLALLPTMHLTASFSIVEPRILKIREVKMSTFCEIWETRQWYDNKKKTQKNKTIQFSKVEKKNRKRKESEPSIRLDSSAVYGDAAKMPPSSILSTQYTARWYPVIYRGLTTQCHDITLLLVWCGASASAGVAVKWCHFNNESIYAGYYATRERIRIRLCIKSRILIFNDSRVTLSKTNWLVFMCLCMFVISCYAENIFFPKTSNKPGIRITLVRRTVNSYYKFSPDSSSSSYTEHRSFSILAVAERKQQVCV